MKSGALKDGVGLTGYRGSDDRWVVKRRLM